MLILAVLLSVGLAELAQGYAVGPSEPWAICAATAQANQSGLEASLTPANGATVIAGTPVTFNGHSEEQPTFSIASSSAQLASPNIDSGLGSALAEPFSTGPPVVYTYTFASTKAAATPRTVYWDVSFSDGGIAACAGLTLTIYTTQVRVLTVLPAPAPTPPPALPPAPAPLAASPPVQVSVGAPGVLHLFHSIITYTIHCTTSCSGDTSYKAFAMRHHAKPVRVSKLDFGPRVVSIAAASRGDERFTHRFSIHALHLLKGLLANNGAVELWITAHVKDAAGNVAQAHGTIQLRA